MGTSTSERIGIRYEDFATFTSWAESEKAVPEDLIMEVLQNFVTGLSLKQAIKKFAMNSPVRTDYILNQFGAFAIFDKLGEGDGDAGYSVEVLPASTKFVELPDLSTDKEISQKKHKACTKTEEDIEFVPMDQVQTDLVRRLVVLVMKRYGISSTEVNIERIGP